jgi:hypothetical protein
MVVLRCTSPQVVMVLILLQSVLPPKEEVEGVRVTVRAALPKRVRMEVLVVRVVVVAHFM